MFAFHPGHGSVHGSQMSYGGASSIAAGGGDAANRSLDWDVQSGLTDSFDRPGSVFTAGSGGNDPGSGAARPEHEHSVFVLMEEEEKAMEAEAEAAVAAGAAKEESGATGSAKDVGAAL